MLSDRCVAYSLSDYWYHWSPEQSNVAGPGGHPIYDFSNISTADPSATWPAVRFVHSNDDSSIENDDSSIENDDSSIENHDSSIENDDSSLENDDSSLKMMIYVTDRGQGAG